MSPSPITTTHPITQVSSQKNLRITGKMPLKPFSFPLPETRFFHTAKYVYKFKIRYGVHFTTEDTENNEQVMAELLDSIKAILANHDHLQPFSTKHFTIFPYKSKWDSASQLRFKHRQKFLQPFPYVFTIYVEPYVLVYDSRVETSSEKQSSQISENPAEETQRKDEETHDREKCMNTDNKECHITNDSHELHSVSCPTLGHNTQQAGGFVDFLMSFTLFRYLFGKRQSA
ncbi:membrane-anchored junction protein isoform X2 [Ranitomeya variabilis]|uniref:membrane-anchored junction protein isoform X2 n=1 Tax=Ranitomeya variabilis TaxID=490064 RepID=UPI004055DAE4